MCGAQQKKGASQKGRTKLGNKSGLIEQSVKVGGNGGTKKWKTA